MYFKLYNSFTFSFRHLQLYFFFFIHTPLFSSIKSEKNGSGPVPVTLSRVCNVFTTDRQNQRKTSFVSKDKRFFKQHQQQPEKFPSLSVTNIIIVFVFLCIHVPYIS